MPKLTSVGATKNALRMPEFGRAHLEAWRTVEMTISKRNGLAVKELLPVLEAWSQWQLRMS